MPTLTIDRGQDTPVYEQVAGQLRSLIASGELAVGASLPPVRRLAGDLGVNLNTIARAYRLLESEGFLEIRGRAGVRVAAPARKVEKTAGDGLLDELRTLLARLRQAGMGGEELEKVVRREIRVLEPGGKEIGDE